MEYRLINIPDKLWERVRVKCVREKTSTRVVILRLLEKWADEKALEADKRRGK